jgi:hypothetical protein
MEIKGLDVTDMALAKTIASHLINSLGQQRRRGGIIGVGVPKRARVWQLP